MSTALTGWFPPQWQQPALFTLTAPSQAGNSSATAGATTIYVFDAIPRVEHAQDFTLTKNPVQTGAPLTDHIYRMPARVVLEIKMSDAMQSYTTGQFSGSTSRSVNAYQTVLGIAKALSIVQVSTRLNQYSNMAIASIRAIENPETLYGSSFIVTFEEVIGVSSQTNTNGASSAVSAAPQITDSTVSGQVQGLAVTPAILGQFAVSGTSNVPAAGAWSSENVTPANQVPSSTAQVLPLTPSPNQAFNFTLQLNTGTSTLQVGLNFNTIAGYWVMSISNQAGTPIVSGVPLITGIYPAANILAPYQYLGIGSAYVLNSSGTTSPDYPNATDLGTDFVLIFDNTPVN